MGGVLKCDGGAQLHRGPKDPNSSARSDRFPKEKDEDRTWGLSGFTKSGMNQDLERN